MVHYSGWPTYFARVHSHMIGREGTNRFHFLFYSTARECLPVNTVERAGFRKMVKTFDSKYDISRIALPSLYATVK